MHTLQRGESKSTGKVLICDDHAVLRGLLRSNLESWYEGIEVLEAEDAETAVQVATETDPDLVIMDIALPGMNGIEATRAIKRANHEIPVIILTVHELEAYREDALAAGADRYVVKRHMQTELEEVLRGMFGETAQALETQA